MTAEQRLAARLPRDAHLEAENANLRAALEVIRDRFFTGDRVYEAAGLRTASQIAQAALDGELFSRLDRTRLV